MKTALLVVLILCRPLQAETDAKIIQETLQSTVSEILRLLRDKEMDRRIKKEKVTAAAMPLFDVPVMAKLIVGSKHWSKLTARDKERFMEVFIKLVQSSYYDKVDLLSDEKVEYEKPVFNKGKSKSTYSVTTYVVTKDKRFKIVYKFHKPDKPENPQRPWKVYDVELQGISIVKSYGQQYQDYLSSEKGSFEGLLDQMRKKTEEFEKQLQSGKKEEISISSQTVLPAQ